MKRSRSNHGVPTSAVSPFVSAAIARTRVLRGADEGRSQEQVLGRIAGDRELGEEHELGALCARVGESGENALAVAVQVADDRVDLGESEPHRDDSTGLRLSGENTVTIDRRFRGPLHSGNGGYTAGRLAAFVDGPAEVTLRLPPPLDRPLTVAEEDGRVLLLDGEALVAEARPGGPRVDAPSAVTFAEAEEAATRHVRFAGENFSECFSCGIRPDDGLCINPGSVRGTDLHAAPWIAHDVSPEVVWAAIDCSGAYAVGGPGRGEVVLGRMAAEIHRLPEEGERCVVVAWPLGEDGRKLYAGTALLGADGEPLALARQTWIQPRNG